MSFGYLTRDFAVAGAWPLVLYTHPADAKSIMRPIAAGGRFQSSATVGNRLLRLEVNNDAGLTVDVAAAGNSQAANLTNRYTWTHRIASFSSLTSGSVFPSYIPSMFLLPGWSIQVRDVNNIDAAADTIEIFMQYIVVPADNYNSGADAADLLGHP